MPTYKLAHLRSVDVRGRDSAATANARPLAALVNAGSGDAPFSLILDVLAVESTQPTQTSGEQVAASYPGELTLRIASEDLGTLEPFRAPPPETKWLPGKPSLTTRLSNWLGGKR